ncbi:MAG: T9SS type A sorting domain-containing protein, partial [Bacteroidota bacterium]
LSNYSAVFLILGNATQGTHALNAGEAAQLEQYLQKNGNLYMEGYFTWYYSNNTVLHPYFKYTTAICPQYTFSQAGGILSTFTDGMSFNYSGSPNFAQFTFVPVNPAYSTFVNADTPGRTLEIVYSGADYKTIGTFLEFASMTDGAEPSTRRTLMQRYLDFFGLNLSGPHPLFHADHTEVCQGSAVNFTDDSFDNIQSWQWEFTGGAPGSSNEPNPVVHYDVPGTFDVKLTVSDGVNTRSLTRKNYISVNVCTGGEEFTQPSPFKVFPNPAHEKIWIEPNHEISGKCRFTLYDLAGRKVSAKEINTGNVSKRIEWNLSGLRKGIYFLRMQGDGHTGVQKVVVK